MLLTPHVPDVWDHHVVQTPGGALNPLHQDCGQIFSQAIYCYHLCECKLLPKYVIKWQKFIKLDIIDGVIGDAPMPSGEWKHHGFPTAHAFETPATFHILYK